MSENGQSEQREALEQRLAAVERHVQRQVFYAQHATVRELAGLTYLEKALDPAAWIPAAGGWACSYEAMATMVDDVLSWENGGDVIEMGSGISTVWLGLAVRQLGLGGTVTAIEHDPVWATRTRALVSRHGLDDVATVVDAPLHPSSGWYTLDGWAPRGECRLLFVDGPPGVGRPLAREPAFRHFHQGLASGASVVVDDIKRSDEAAMVERWTAEAPAGTVLEHVGEFGGAGFYRFIRQSG